MLGMEAGRERRVRKADRTQEMGEAGWRERGRGEEASGKQEGAQGESGRQEPPKSPLIGCPDRHRAPAGQWNPMQQLKSTLSIHIDWRGETSAVYC